MIDTDPLIETYKILQRLEDGTITLRQIERLVTVSKVATWRMKQEVKKCSHQLIHKKELNKIVEAIYENIFDKFYTLYKTQNLGNTHMIHALLWEVSVDICADQSYYMRLLNGDPIPTELVERILNNIALGLRDGNVQPKTESDYQDKIGIITGRSKNDLEYIFHSIKTLDEYQTVFDALSHCSYVVHLPKRDRRKIYIQKKKIEKKKLETIENLKFFGLPYDEVEKIKPTVQEEWVNYETTLKHLKDKLYQELIHRCATGKRRAREITEILEFI